jgi:hypothetical protein
MTLTFLFQLNNTTADNLSLVEAQRLLEKSRDKLHLVTVKENNKLPGRHKRQNSEPLIDGKFELRNFNDFGNGSL